MREIVSSMKCKGFNSYYEITFDQTFRITESFYSSPSLSTLFADLGGSLGSWLGLGILQLSTITIIINVIEFIKNIQLYFRK